MAYLEEVCRNVEKASREIGPDGSAIVFMLIVGLILGAPWVVYFVQWWVRAIVGAVIGQWPTAF